MFRASLAFVVLVVFAAALLPMTVPPARAANVPVSLFARNFAWNVGTESSGVATITANIGDRLQLTIENRDTELHTFTANHFPAAPNQGGSGTFLNVSLPAGRIFFVNLTMTAADAGAWQYYCIPHSSGTYPNRAGMVGVISVVAPPPPFVVDPLLLGSLLLVVVIVVAGVAVAMRRRKKAP